MGRRYSRQRSDIPGMYKVTVKNLAPRGYCTVPTLAVKLKTTVEVIYGWVHCNKILYWHMCGTYFVPINPDVKGIPNQRRRFKEVTKKGGTGLIRTSTR